MVRVVRCVGECLLGEIGLDTDRFAGMGSKEEDAPRLRRPWWFSRARELSDEQRRQLLSQLYFDGPDRGPFLRRFAVLLALSVLIAVFGIAEDSVPVVIGAMLVSPLTTPLLGLSAGLVMGWPRRQLQSLRILLIATVGAVGFAWLAMKAIPEPQTLTVQSQQLLARTEPRLLDLAIAIVAGAAGAYVLVRREAVGALPGVAIAVALVPPVSAIGMTLELGRADLADEALLLYVTNLAGIILAASFTLLILGVRPKLEGHPKAIRRVRIGIGIAVLLVLLISYPLAAVTISRVEGAIDNDNVHRTASTWLADTGLRLENATISGDSVHVDVVGPRRPPPASLLAKQLGIKLGHPVDVTVGWTKQSVMRASSG
jgi:uncharacterized hydrophobic protein (TIGR00271 family)